MIILRLVVLVLGCMGHACAALKCLDNNGDQVEWWFMYKMPNGYKFSYIDPDYAHDPASPLEMYPREMNDENDPVAITRTLQALAEDMDTRFSAYSARSAGNASKAASSTPSYYLYNDEPDVGTASSTYGHTKGVVAAGPDHKSGLWLVHSTPRWPASSGKAKFYFPDREITYGQTFLCMSLDLGQLDAVGKQQLLTRPFIYHKTSLFAEDNATIASYYPSLAQVLAGNWDTTPGTGVQQLNQGSSSEPTFTSLAKNKEWDDDIWENLVAKHYGSGFVVESWMRGQQLGPYCPPDKAQTVVDARTLYVTVNGTNVTWKETQDHAKWGVALDSSFVVCVGDMNRMISQRKRGGGAVCFNNKKLCYGMYKSILTSDVCSHEQPAWARDDLATPTTTPTTPTTPKPQRKQDRKMKRADGI